MDSVVAIYLVIGVHIAVLIVALAAFVWRRVLRIRTLHAVAGEDLLKALKATRRRTLIAVSFAVLLSIVLSTAPPNAWGFVTPLGTSIAISAGLLLYAVLPAPKDWSLGHASAASLEPRRPWGMLPRSSKRVLGGTVCVSLISWGISAIMFSRDSHGFWWTRFDAAGQEIGETTIYPGPRQSRC